MLKKLSRGLVVAVAGLFGIAGALPASAAPIAFSVEMTDGTIDVGGTAFETPGDGDDPECPGATDISGTIDPDDGTIEAELDIATSEFPLPIFGGNYVLTATGSSNIGDYDAQTRTFANLVFDEVSFDISSVNPTDCTPQRIVCYGTASLVASGGLDAATSLPPLPGDEVFINATGAITSAMGSSNPGASCPFPWSVAVSVGASVTVGPNTDARGAIFTA